MRMPGLRALSLLLFCVVGLSLSAQAGDAKLCDEQPAPPVLAVNSGGQSNEQAATATAPPVELWFGEWRSELPPGVSLVIGGGSLVNNSFPALSADGSKIAILYHAPHPMKDAYPTLDIYSTASLSLQERIELVFEPELRNTPNLSDPLIVARVEQRIQYVNCILRRGNFRSMTFLFDFGANGYTRGKPVEALGKRITYRRPDENEASILTITSLASVRVELEMAMPVIPVIEGHEDPYTNCSVEAFPSRAWYAPEIRVVVLQLSFTSARDDCDLPEQWLLKRLYGGDDGTQQFSIHATTAQPSEHPVTARDAARGTGATAATRPRFPQRLRAAQPGAGRRCRR